MEREGDLEQRERKDQEKAEYVRARQERLGHVVVEEEPPPKPKAKPKAKAAAKKEE